MKQPLKEKLKRIVHNNSGETIAETLVTMIILSLAVLMVAGAVVTAARVNKKADNTDTAFVVGNPQTEQSTVTISEKNSVGTGNSVTMDVRIYETEKKADKKYYYYDIIK